MRACRGRWLLLGSLVLAPPAVAADPTLDVTRIDAHIRATMEAWAVPGIAVGIARDGEVIHLAAFGRAGANDRPMASDTPIIVGSVGKSITALAVRQLVESGELDLGAPVDRYLPWFELRASPSVTRQITIEDLLEHTSGISTADGQDQRWYAPGLTPEEVVRAMTSIAPDRPAGTYEYSNLNYVLLGVIVEAVSGQSYSDYLRDHIFEPLGMLDSTTDLRGAVAHGGMAEGHRYLFGLATPFAEPFPSGMVPAGYQISTAEDMSHFVAALSNGGHLRGRRRPHTEPASSRRPGAADRLADDELERRGSRIEPERIDPRHQRRHLDDAGPPPWRRRPAECEPDPVQRVACRRLRSRL